MVPALVIGGALSAYQLYQSERQRRAAENLANQDRPNMQLPNAVKNATKVASYNASLTEAPGSAQYKRGLQEAVAESFSRGKDVLRGPYQAQGLLEQAQAKSIEGQVQLAAQNAQYQAAARQALVGQLQNEGQMQYQIDYQNQMVPYERQMAAASALYGASKQNQFGALQNFAGLAMVGLSSPAGQEWWKGLWGKNGGAVTDPTGQNSIIPNNPPFVDPAQNVQGQAVDMSGNSFMNFINWPQVRT